MFIVATTRADGLPGGYATSLCHARLLVYKQRLTEVEKNPTSTNSLMTSTFFFRNNFFFLNGIYVQKTPQRRR